MLKEGYLNSALKSIQDLLIHGRKLAHEHISNNDMAVFFDGMEYLPALILETEDRTDLFNLTLMQICNDYNCNEVYDRHLKRISAQ